MSKVWFGIVAVLCFALWFVVFKCWMPDRDSMLERGQTIASLTYKVVKFNKAEKRYVEKIEWLEEKTKDDDAFAVWAATPLPAAAVEFLQQFD